MTPYVFFIANGRAIARPVGGGSEIYVSGKGATNVQAQGGKVIVTYENGDVMERPWPGEGGMERYLVHGNRKSGNEKRDTKTAASREPSERFDYRSSGVMDRIMEMLVFWFIVAPCTYYLFLDVKENVSAGGTTTQIEVFGAFESVLLAVAFWVRKPLGRLLKNVLWLAFWLILITVVFLLMDYLHDPVAFRATFHF